MIARRPPKRDVTLAESWDGLRADYDMSRENRFTRRRTGLSPQGGSADWHYRSETAYYQDIEKARDMDRNDAVVGQTIDRAVTNIVQDGFRLDVQTNDKKLDADLKSRWDEWSTDPERCDIAGEYCFHDFEYYATRGMLADGDCVCLGLDSGELQYLEGHTIQTTTRIENTFLGVTRNQYGRRERYWVVTDPIDPNRGTKEQAKPVEVRNEQGQRTLFHTYRPKRVSQTRGVTAFAPIFALTGMFEDIQFAKLVQQQVVSCFAILRYQDHATPPLPTKGDGNAPDYGRGTMEQTTEGLRDVPEIAPGMEYTAAPGEKLEGFSPNVPNAEFFQHARLTLQMIGLNLGMPLVMMLMDASETNFSGFRGAVDEARRGFRINQRSIADRLHEPAYRWKLSQWLSQDAALRNAAKRSGIKIAGHRWTLPAWSYIQPEVEAKADALRWQSGLTSPRRIQAERSADEWTAVANEIVEDHSHAIQVAKKEAAKINKRFPDDPVHWRDLVNLPMVSNANMTMQDPAIVASETEGVTINAE